MRPVLVAPLLLAAAPAWAAWPNDVSLSGMERHDGALLAEPVTEDYVSLVRQLGAGLASFPALPANTTAIDGFDVAVGNSFWMIDAVDPEAPTPWQRAHPTEQPEAFQQSPSLIVRKGLPLSLEVGGGLSWFAGSSAGAVHAFGRMALLEGRLPLPELAVHTGYTALVGHDELKLGVFEIGGTIGTTAPLERWTGVTQSTVSPFLDVSLLSTRAAPVVDEELAERVGLVRVGGQDAPEAALTGLRLTGGLEVASGPALLRLTAAWTTGTPLILGVATGVGF